jgi:protein-disulfide isomerase
MGVDSRAHRFNWRGGLDLLASIGMIAVAATLLLNGRSLRTSAPPRSPAIAIPSQPVALAGLPTKGDPRASVALILYSDFECPFCRRFALDVLPVVGETLVDKGALLLAFAHLPLESIHRNAFAAAALAECSHRQGRFWEAHDRLFSTTPLSPAVIAALAAEKGLAKDATCLTTEGADVVRRQQQAAGALGITSTPAFLVGTLQSDGRLLVKRTLTGLQSAETIASAVRDLATATK